MARATVVSENKPMGFTMNFSGHSEYTTCTLLGALMVHFSYLGRTERGPMGTEIACKRKAITSRDYVFLGYTGRGGQTRSDKPISDTGVYLLFKHYCQVVGAGTHAPPPLAPGRQRSQSFLQTVYLTGKYKSFQGTQVFKWWNGTISVGFRWMRMWGLGWSMTMFRRNYLGGACT